MQISMGEIPGDLNCTPQDLQATKEPRAGETVFPKGEHTNSHSLEHTTHMEHYTDRVECSFQNIYMNIHMSMQKQFMKGEAMSLQKSKEGSPGRAWEEEVKMMWL